MKTELSSTSTSEIQWGRIPNIAVFRHLGEIINEDQILSPSHHHFYLLAHVGAFKSSSQRLAKRLLIVGLLMTLYLPACGRRKTTS
jgi:hypothetical protein